MRRLAPVAMLACLTGCMATGRLPEDFPRSAEECLAQKHLQIDIDLRSALLDEAGSTRINLGKVGLCVEGERIVGIAVSNLAEWSDGSAGSSYQLRYHVKKVGGMLRMPALDLTLDIDQVSLLLPGESAPRTSLEEIDARLAAYGGALKAANLPGARFYALIAGLIDAGKLKPLRVKADILGGHVNINGTKLPAE